MPTDKTQEMKDGVGIPREALPQIPKGDIPKFIRILQKHGVKITAHVVPAFAIKPIQKNANKEKLKSMQPDIYNFDQDPFIVSDKLYLMDGNHRWLIIKGANKNAPVRIIHVHLPMDQLLKLANAYEGTHHRGEEDDTA